MDNKTLSLILLSLLLLAGFAEYLPKVSAHGADWPLSYDSKHLIIDTIASPETTDPAWCYDTASAELIMNVYETLVAFNISYTRGPYNAGLPSEFAPRLANDTGTYKVINEYDPVTGQTWLRRITFAIRFTNVIGQDVTFHNLASLTMEDVEYSFERWMVQDRAGGPTWMILQPLLNCYKAKPPAGAGSDANFGIKIDRAVQHNSTHLWFNLATTYPGVTVLQILSQACASVVNKAWCIAKGDLDLDKVVNGWANWTYIYNTWHDPATSFIQGAMLGTGPYKFGYWNPGYGWEINRYSVYWDGWPARVSWNGDERIGGYVNKVTVREIPEFWGVVDVNNVYIRKRKDNFLNGTSDFTVVPRMYRDQVLGQIVPPPPLLFDGEKVKCFYPFDTLALDAFFYTYDINTISPYMGVPGGLAPGTFSQAGIPPNIFGKHSQTGVDEGLNVRKGIAYLFDYKSWLLAAYLGEGWQPSDYIVSGLAYDNPAQEMYTNNPTLAIQYLQNAWGGELWNNGMKFTIVYNVGNVPRQTAAEMIRDKLQLANNKFHVEVIGVPWGSVFLPQMIAGELPLFTSGWTADFPDPHDFAYPFMHSRGTFASAQRYSNPVVDALIDAGIEQPDDTTPYPIVGERKWLDIGDPRKPFTNASGTFGFNNYPPTPYTTAQDWLANPPDTRWPRRSMYYALQWYAHDDVPSVPIVQPWGRHWELQWMRGWYYNPIYGGSLTPGIDSTTPTTPSLYAYHLWKAVTHYGDINNDGYVDSVDGSSMSAHWYSPPSVGSLGYAPQADIHGGKGATTGTDFGYVRAVPDGRVNIVDVALLSAYFDGHGVGPYGPVHPP